MSESINRRALVKYVSGKLNKKFSHYHIAAVINILFEELINDLIDGVTISIVNFGNLSLSKTKPRRYYDVRYKQIMQSAGNKILKFQLSKLIRKKICKMIDIDKTFEDD